MEPPAERRTAEGSHLEPGRLRELLGRGVVDVGEARFADYVQGARILVTGAGGSLGRELCRRLVALGAAGIVLVDQSEAALADLHDELRYEAVFGGSVPVLADLRSSARARSVVAEHRPDVVFHTAAYKLVPIVEAHPLEAIANNVLATGVLVDAVLAVGVERFVLYSTDKAVRPRSVLGETKAAAECVVGTAARRVSPTRFACVRLGNVVDSSGSMLPLFRRQIAAGHAITLTDARMTRYLMTAGEATGLAVVAGALGVRGDVFRLDMGRPVRIVDTARAVIRTSGNGGGTPIEIVGRRPGEKLHEALELPGEAAWPTEHERVFRSDPRHADPAWLEAELARLRTLVEEANEAGARAGLARLVRGISARAPAAAGPTALS